MPFRSKGRKFYKTRVTARDGRSIVAGTGTDDLATAKAMERVIRNMRRKREWPAIELIVTKKLKLPEVFDAHEAGTLDDLLALQDSPDLVPLLDEWSGNTKYKTQIRRFLGSVFPATGFTRKAVSKFLAGLVDEQSRAKVKPPVSGATRNRYKAALSVFAGWLVERDVIPHNIVKDVRGSKPNAGRDTWLTREQAKAIVAALDYPHRAIEALMCATGVEWQVITRVRRRDIDFQAKTLEAHGSKTPWRNRTVRGTETWAWEIFASYARDFTDNALIFDGVDQYRALAIHKRASKTLGLPVTTLHDWRHTYSVIALKAGYTATVIAHQLGHHDTYLVQTRYGRHVPDDRDYALHAADSDEVASAQTLGREE